MVSLLIHKGMLDDEVPQTRLLHGVRREILKLREIRMLLRSSLKLFRVLSITSVYALVPIVAANESQAETPKPKVIRLDSGANDYLTLLDGPPETVTMRSGLVVLEPGKSIGAHSTEEYEEVLVVLEGRGQAVITDGPKLEFEASSVVYCPPHTEHDVTNTGQGPLRYVYVVAIGE